ncbi:translation initiation factor IF-2-like [Hordeum vulgare]|nr:translation initiation factor IF-2-like [Hordeum vulgare]
MEEEEASAELISPRISFSHDLAAFAATAATAQPEPRRSDASLLMSRRRRRRAPEPEFDFANAAAADVAPADRLFADGKLLPVPPLPPTAPRARCAKPPQAGAWQRAPRSWASPFARSSSVNSARTAAAASGRFTCPAFPLMRSRSTGSAAAAVGAHQRPHCKKVAPTTTTTAPATASSNNGGARSVYYYGYGGGRNAGDGHGGGGVRVSPVLNVTSIGTSVVNMLSHLLCDCGDKAAKQQSRGFGVRCWVAR